jgi:hypothetical protein
VLLPLPRPAEYAVEDLLAGTPGDTIIIRGDQETEPDERPIKELELGRDEVLEPRNLKPLSELLPSAHLLGTGAATFCPILMGEFMGCGAVLQQSDLCAAGAPVVRPYERV